MGVIAMRLTSLRVGFFLAWRQILRSGRGTSALIIVIMTLTFLNLVVVNGILVGLVQGSSQAYRTQYSGDVLITNKSDESFIGRSQSVLRTVSGFSEVSSVTARYVSGGRIIANYRTKVGITERPDIVAAEIAGIDPDDEDAVTGLASRVVEGEYLDGTSEREVLIGSQLLARYTEGSVPGEEGLPDVEVGDRVRVAIGDKTIEVLVHGVVKSKIQAVNRRVFFIDRELRNLLGRTDLNVNEIAIRLHEGGDPYHVVDSLTAAGVAELGDIQTWREAQGDFFEDIETTFRLLGDVIGTIALVVAALTVFIVVLINAITRKRYIGIMKGIGICGNAITASYVYQSLFFALVGSGIGLSLLYGFIKPYIDANPIDFPFSDGIIVAPVPEVLGRVVALLVITMLAGYLPARIIVSRNTLKTILGR